MRWKLYFQLARISEDLSKRSGPEKALRDVLLLDLADATGWRAGSLSSVPVAAFSDEVIALAQSSNEDHIWVTPALQKFGYQAAFKVPFPLAVRINRYCKDSRAELLRKLGKDESTANGFLFLSTRSATPLDHEYISRIVGSALTAIGVQQRAGAHAVRRKFADDLTAEHHAVRKASGLSTAPEDVLRPVADALGQQSLHSQESYQRVVMSDVEMSHEHKLRQELQKQGSELAAKDHEIARLRKLLVKSSS
ncbi:hypothetical protein E4T66_21220 [Sinimarinibacterium sp. CAU 1509]|uniref:hypothetical protein n=1 Tax=Sinimarinibacterium sp. CAU 1509 TaxID=2562283 RepID=UPI0010AB7521|nr:hypothetical protein [Sinimarinibacterium sp. CAU 1509]TJY54801.1 hypothetical protein E4T66_21220 [Sinimarinibacterium sp. CAU 1509]